MSKTVFRHFDEFAESIAGVDGRFVPTARSTAEWWLHGGQTRRMSLQQLQIGGCATFAGSGQQEKITVGLPMTDARCMRIDGHELQEDCFIVMDREQPFSFAGVGVTRWCGITLPLDHPIIGAQSLEFIGRAHSVRARTQLEELNYLRRRVNRALSSDPNVTFEHPAAVAAVEQEIALAVAEALECSHPDRARRVIGRPNIPRKRAIARCLELIEAKQGSQVALEDLCRAANMSERTLRTVFREHFGVPPARLLRVKQLWDIRAALLGTQLGHEPVTQIVARFGIWDYCLFARHYKALFGELPTQPCDHQSQDVAEARRSLGFSLLLGFFGRRPGSDERGHLRALWICSSITPRTSVPRSCRGRQNEDVLMQRNAYACSAGNDSWSRNPNPSCIISATR